MLSQPHSLQVQEGAVNIDPHPIPSALITVATPTSPTEELACSEMRLPGPFTIRAGIGFPPYPDSLDLALMATLPVRCLSSTIQLHTIAQSAADVKLGG